MGFWDYASWAAGPVGGLAYHYRHQLFDGPGDAATQDALKNGKQYNYLGQSEYHDDWNALLQQLHATASGSGPSLAGNAYDQAQQTGLSNQVAMSKGRSAGSARAGALGLAQQQQGYAQGYGQARTTEEMQAMSAYQNALAGADASQYNRDAANQNAYLQALKGAQGQQSTFQKALGVAGQIGGMVGVTQGGAGAGAKGYSGQAPPNGYPGMQQPMPMAPQGYSQNPYGPSDFQSYFQNKGY